MIGRAKQAAKFALLPSFSIAAAQTVCSRKRLHPQIPFKSNNTNSGGQKPAAVRGAEKGICAFSGAPRCTPHRGVQFALLPSVSIIVAQTVCSRKRLHPQIPFCYLFLAKQKTRRSGLFVWRRERDLNPWIHSCITRFRIVRVRPLRHLCKVLIYSTITFPEMQAICTAFGDFFCVCRFFLQIGKRRCVFGRVVLQ